MATSGWRTIVRFCWVAFPREPAIAGLSAVRRARRPLEFETADSPGRGEHGYRSENSRHRRQTSAAGSCAGQENHCNKVKAHFLLSIALAVCLTTLRAETSKTIRIGAVQAKNRSVNFHLS